MMKLGTFCSLSLPVSHYSTRSNSDVRSPPANSYRRHVLQPIRKITSRISFIIIAISFVPLNIRLKFLWNSSCRFSYSGAFETESSLEEN
jgi:hypothetical protein